MITYKSPTQRIHSSRQCFFENQFVNYVNVNGLPSTVRQVPLHRVGGTEGYLGGRGLIIYYITTIRGKRRRNNTYRRIGQMECTMRGYATI